MDDGIDECVDGLKSAQIGCFKYEKISFKVFLFVEILLEFIETFKSIELRVFRFFPLGLTCL